MAVDGDFEWLSDYVVSILKSPTWVTPIAGFIDDRCDFFDDKEENELMHTACHNEFKQLVNDLLVSHLQEVSVSADEFERFCETGLTGHTRLHRALIEQLLSVDDFLVFKAMMAKHNAELSREAITCYTIEDEDEANQEIPSPTRLLADGLVGNSIAQGLMSADAEWQLYEAACLTRDRVDTGESVDSQEAQLRLEEAELAHAIALSLQLEEERLRQLTSQDDKTQVTEASAVLAPAPPPALPASAGCLSSPLCPVPPKLRKSPTPQPKILEVESLAPMVKPRGGVWGFTSAPLCPAPPRLLPEPVAATPVATPPVAAPPEVPKVVGFTSSPLCYRPPHLKPEPAPASPGVAMVEPQPLPEQPNAQRVPTMELDDMRSNLQLWRERAERAFVRPAPVITKHLPGSIPQAAPVAGPSDEERRQRAEHLRNQRDRLRAKRQREREQQMVEFQISRGGTGIAPSLDRAAAQAASAAEGRRLVAALSPGAVVASPSAPPMGNAPVAAERMRQALTLQLRQTLMRTDVSDAGVLDSQLSQLELLKSG